MNKLVIYEGTIVTCPKCVRILAEARRDIYSNDRRESKDFIELFAGAVKHNCRMECPVCEVLYYDQFLSKLHTNKGWVSTRG